MTLSKGWNNIDDDRNIDFSPKLLFEQSFPLATSVFVDLATIYVLLLLLFLLRSIVKKLETNPNFIIKY